MTTVWHALGWVYNDNGTCLFEVWSASDPGDDEGRRLLLVQARDLFYTVGSGVVDKDTWAGADGAVLKFVAKTHPLASIETRAWTRQ